MEQMKIRGIEVTCYPDKIKIEKSYIINNKEKMELILESIFERTEEFFVNRKMETFIKEWRYHNRLYKMHIFREKNKNLVLKKEQSNWSKFMCVILGF